jgi:hypothetical protein
MNARHFSPEKRKKEEEKVFAHLSRSYGLIGYVLLYWHFLRPTSFSRYVFLFIFILSLSLLLFLLLDRFSRYYVVAFRLRYRDSSIFCADCAEKSAGKMVSFSTWIGTQEKKK